MTDSYQERINPNKQDKIESLYIHVPYCTKKCGYCDFYSVTSKLADYEAFSEGIKREWKRTLAYLEENKQKLGPLKTFYLGGGTPSVLPPETLNDLIEFFKFEIGFSNNLELTMEVNPEALGRETVLRGIEAGVNRISLGFQAKQDYLLKKIGRLHKYEDFLIMLDLVRAAGVTNISCDLMFGLPDQTLEDALDSAQVLTDLQIPHISLYSLILEENTLFYKEYANNPELLPSDELERKMYKKLLAFIRDQSYNYYELSSAAKAGYFSRHNYNYWTTKPYLGLGPGAHAYFNGMRKGNVPSIKKWLDKPWENSDFEIIDFNLATREYAMLAFRMAEGFSPNKFKDRFRMNQPFQKELIKLEKDGLIYLDGESYKLTEKGLDFANIVFMEFL